MKSELDLSMQLTAYKGEEGSDQNFHMESFVSGWSPNQIESVVKSASSHGFKVNVESVDIGGKLAETKVIIEGPKCNYMKFCQKVVKLINLANQSAT